MAMQCHHSLEPSSYFVGSDLSTCVTDALLQPVRELEQVTHWKVTAADDDPCSTVYTPCLGDEQGVKKCSLDELPLQQV